jgi:hypothetical protein
VTSSGAVLERVPQAIALRMKPAPGDSTELA